MFSPYPARAFTHSLTPGRSHPCLWRKRHIRPIHATSAVRITSPAALPSTPVAICRADPCNSRCNTVLPTSSRAAVTSRSKSSQKAPAKPFTGPRLRCPVGLPIRCANPTSPVQTSCARNCRAINGLQGRVSVVCMMRNRTGSMLRTMKLPITPQTGVGGWPSKLLLKVNVHSKSRPYSCRYLRNLFCACLLRTCAGN